MNSSLLLATEERAPEFGALDLPSPADELLRLSSSARSAGSPFVAEVLGAGYRQLHRAPQTAALVHGWPGDPAEAALAMRFNAALHFLARRGRPAALAGLYCGQHDDFDEAIGQALACEDSFIASAMRYPTQTNEVGRAAAILAALLETASHTGLPCELLELGSSCGLNLNLAHYAYDLGGLSWGQTAGSPVHLAPRWRGSPPPAADLRILSARGVDLKPFDACDPETVDRLMSFVWAGDAVRSARLAQALDLARRHRPRVDRGNAVAWLRKRLDDPQGKGVCRVVFHSMFRQYLSVSERAALQDTIGHAGARADVHRPLAAISFEWTADRREVRLLLTTWPGGGTRHLATCDPYGAWIDWK